MSNALQTDTLVPAEPETVVGIDSATKRYGDSVQLAPNAVSLAIGRNEFFTLLGPSGCGKTTKQSCDLTMGELLFLPIMPTSPQRYPTFPAPDPPRAREFAAYLKTCPTEVNDIYSQKWTELMR